MWQVRIRFPYDLSEQRLNNFSEIGAYGWTVAVEKPIGSLPSSMPSVVVYLAPLPDPQGYMDPNIKPRDKVKVYGMYQGADKVALFGSS